MPGALKHVRDPKTGRKYPRGNMAVKRFIDSLPESERESVLRFRYQNSASKNRHKGPGASVAYAREQLVFVGEYLRDFSVRRAGERCGLTYNQAYAIFKEPAVQKRIQDETTARYKRLQRQADDVIQRMWEIVDADPEAAYDEDGKLKPLTDIPPELRRSLAEYDPSRNRIKLQAKDGARTDLAKVHRLLTENINITAGRQTWAELVIASMPPAERPEGWQRLGLNIPGEVDAEVVSPPALPEPK